MKFLKAFALLFVLTVLPVSAELVIDPGTNLRTGTISRNGRTYEIRPGADLTFADLSDANLSDANLSGADLFAANLSGADLSGADLAGVRSGAITGTPIALPSDWVFVNGHLVGPGANLIGANLSNASLNRANLIGANLSNASLNRADLRSTNITGADLTGANLRSANLTGANLRYSDIRRADFTGADLTDADLMPVFWSNTDFTGANLTDTNFGDGFDGFGLNGIKIAALQTELAEKDAKITSLEDRMTALEAQVALLANANAGVIQQLQEQIAQLSQRPTLEEVRDARAGSVVLTADRENNEVTLNLRVEETDDLKQGTWTTADGGDLKLTLALAGDKRFMRLALSE